MGERPLRMGEREVEGLSRVAERVDLLFLWRS